MGRVPRAGQVTPVRSTDPDDAASLFALRFVRAFANDDHDTCRALFEVAGQAGENDFTASVLTLVTHTGSFVRASVPSAR